MLTRKKFFRALNLVVTLLLLFPLCGTAAGQKADVKTRFKKVIPWVQVPTKTETFEEFAEGKKPAEIKTQFWKGLGVKKPEEQRFADVKKLVAELPITKDGKRVPSATLAETQKIVWDNYCFERMMSQRLIYLCCFWPFEDEKQAFFIEFQNKYSMAKPETRAKIDADFATFFIKQAAKENLTFTDWELREAMMQHLLCRVVLERIESTKPGKLTDKELAKLIKEQAGKLELKYEGKEVNLSDIYTDWEITDTIIRLKNTMLINSVVENVPANEITKLGFDIIQAGAAQEHLGAKRLNVQQLSGHVAEMQRMLAKIGRVDRAIRTSLVLGDKPALLMLGSNDREWAAYSLAFCMMQTVMENGPLVCFPTTSTIDVANRQYGVLYNLSCSSMIANIAFSKAVKLDSIPVDLHPRDSKPSSDRNALDAYTHARHAVMVETMSDYLLSPHGKAERVAVGIFYNDYLKNFHKPPMANTLKNACVPISVGLSSNSREVTFEWFDPRSEHPSVFGELRVWDILRRLYPNTVPEFAKAFWQDNNDPIAGKIRACNNVDVYSGKHEKTLGNIAICSPGMSAEMRQGLKTMQDAWEKTFAHP